MLAGTPRVGIEKVWRTVRWAESFPDESLAMDTVDLTPTFAIRKIAMLFDRRKFAECAALVTRLNGITITAILTEIPVEMLHNALPASLPILEALYEKVNLFLTSWSTSLGYFEFFFFSIIYML